jgi:hypothetical protein
VGYTPILREWWSRDHLSAISAMSPEGKRYFACPECALDAEDVVALLAHLLREVPDRMVISWDGARMHHHVEAFNLGYIYGKQDMTGTAKTFYTKALQIDPRQQET